MKNSLNDLKKAIKGEVLLSADLEDALNSLKNGEVPAMWIAKSYPSLKKLGGYNQDMLERLAWFADWVENGMPPFLWITRFFFTQGFLTGQKQNYARKYNIAIDLLDYDFTVITDMDQLEVAPEDGVNVTGMYIEGCKWDDERYCLEESDPKILFVKCPPVWFKPCKPEEFSAVTFYDCPIYKTSVRKGVLMTTGHSTNFVLLLRMPTKLPPEHWIKRGTALLLGLDD
jgi:dynein heavy chain